jgi:hypothetical protein
MTSRQRTVVALSLIGFAAAAIVAVLYTILSGPRRHDVTVAPATAPASATAAVGGTPARPSITFEDGTTFRLLGIREFGTERPWWGTDGTPIPPPAAKTPSGHPANFGATRPDRRLIEVRFDAITASGEPPDFTFRIPGMRGLGRSDGLIVASVPADQAAGDLQIGLRTGPWVRLLEADVKLDAPTTTVTTRPTTPPAGNPHVAFGDIRYENGRLKVELIDRRTNEERMQSVYGVVALMAPDDRERLRRTTSVRDGHNVYEFDVAREQVRGVAFQIRRIEWKTLPNFACKPLSAAPATAP